MTQDLQPGDRLGRWRLDRQLGSGSFGQVWAVSDDDGQPGALKLLPGPPGEELRTLARVCHPSVPALLDAQGAPRPYLVMAQAKGRALSGMLRHGPAPAEAALSITALLADALAAVHRAGAVHGDLKPDNVVVGSVQRREVTLIDFGMVGHRTGGTLLYAAPERLSGGDASPEADVYALGLLLWELLHGELPWSALGLSASLARRRTEVPSPDACVPASVRDLLLRMLSLDPSRRPTAAAITDALVAQGHHLRPLQAAQLQARAETVYIERPAVAAARERWLSSSGVLALWGPPGSGRTAALRQVIAAAQAAGTSWVRFPSGGAPWHAVERALQATTLSAAPVALPQHPDPDERVARAAAALEERGGSELLVIADDVEQIDQESAKVLAELAWRGTIRVCVAGTAPPGWSDQSAELGPLGAEALRALVAELLGDAHLAEAIAPRLAELSAGRIKPVVRYLIDACTSGAVQQRAGRWVADRVALDRLAESGGWEGAPRAALSPEAARIGGIIAASRTALALPVLSRLAAAPLEAVTEASQQLRLGGLVVIEQGHVSCASVAADRVLRRACPDLVAAHRALLAGSVADDPNRGWYAVGARDVTVLSAEGAAIVGAMRRRSAEAAVALSAAAWELAPSAALAHLRASALREAGQLAEAAAFLDAALETFGDAPGLWVALARVRAASEAPPEAIHDALSRAEALDDAGAHAIEAAISAVAAFSQQGELVQAVAAAQAVLSGVPPEDDDAIDEWLHLTLQCAQCMARTGTLPEAIALCAAVPASLGQGRPSRALVEATRGRLLWMAGQPREAAACMAAAAEAEQGLAASDRARLLNNVGLARYSIGERLLALRCWEDCLPLLERLGMLADQVRVHNNLCVGYREVGRWERARQAGAWAMANAADAGVPEVAAMAAGNLGDIAADCGDVAEATRWFDQAEGLARDQDVQHELVELARRRAALAVAARAVGARQAAERALERAQACDDVENIHRASALLAVCLARDGQPEEAESRLQKTISELQDAGTAGLLAEVRLTAAEVYLALGWNGRARTAYERARAYAEELGLVPLRDRADRLAAQIRQRAEQPARDSQRLAVLMNLAARIAREEDEQALLQAISDGAWALLDAGRAFVLTFDGDETRIAAQSGEGDAQPSQSIVGRVRETRREVIVGDLLERGDLRAAQSVVAMDLRSAMCAPMLHHGAVLGAIYIDSQHTTDEQLTANAAMLRTLAAYAAAAVVKGRRLSERAEQAARAAEVVHDLRAPIATMITIADEIVARGAEPIAGQELRGLGRRALRLAEDLLAERTPQHRTFNASAVVDEICRHTAPSAREVRRRVCCDAGVSIGLSGDPDALRRLLSNLLSNALRYGDGDIEVTLRAAAPDAVLTVRDHGPGIPEDLRARVFERGVRTGGAGSHGLGTAIALRMAEQLGGTLSVDNHPDGGARFTARFADALAAVA